MSLDRSFLRRVYNTPVGGSWDFKLCRLKIESEEGEILSCPECECELEVSQTHPVALNPISDDIDEEDDEEEEDDDEDDDDFDEDGDLPDDKDDEDEAEE